MTRLPDLAGRIDSRRLWDRHMAMARIGATPNGGVDRQALTGSDADARLLLLDWARDANLSYSTDRLGNMFLRYDGSERSAPPVMTGSHTDSEPTGGRFDGVYGVLAGLEAIQAIRESSLPIRHPIELVVWTNEEGCRFEPGCMGSYAYCFPREVEKTLQIVDPEGQSVSAALDRLFERVPRLPARAMGVPPRAFIEAHIEQGPQLEASDRKIGVVTGIQGSRRYAVTVTGKTAHAGTTPRAKRHDAFVAAMNIVRALQGVFNDPDDTVRFTIGRFNVFPNSPTVVPGRVQFTIDVRHLSASVLEELGGQVGEICRTNAHPCVAEAAETIAVAPVTFPEEIQGVISSAAERLRLAWMSLPSGAGHDARNLARIAPTGMIFIPCLNGVSHHPAESATLDDLAAGARVLAEVLAELAS